MYVHVECRIFIMNIVCASQALENIKLVQLEKYHKAKTDFERDSIEVNPAEVLQHAVDNCKPLLVTKRVHRGGIVYQVLFCTTVLSTDNASLKLLAEFSTIFSNTLCLKKRINFETV